MVVVGKSWKVIGLLTPADGDIIVRLKVEGAVLSSAMAGLSVLDGTAGGRDMVSGSERSKVDRSQIGRIPPLGIYRDIEKHFPKRAR